MNTETQNQPAVSWPTLAHFTLPARVLATMVIMTMAIAMVGAVAQVVVHDIIPTFIEMRASDDSDSGAGQTSTDFQSTDETGDSRGDLFSEEMDVEAPVKEKAFYESEQFVWTLKWTHIHLFGINMIFIFLGGITLFLNLPQRSRAWLIGLPFLGILLDIAAMWLKAFVSPAFFWLHIPGGGLFGAIFVYVIVRALWEMWALPETG